MAKIRIYELARELVETGLVKDSKTLNSDIINLLSENGIEGKSASSGLDDSMVELVKKHYSKKDAKKAKKADKKEEAVKEEPKKEEPKKEEPKK